MYQFKKILVIQTNILPMYKTLEGANISDTGYSYIYGSLLYH